MQQEGNQIMLRVCAVVFAVFVAISARAESAAYARHADGRITSAAADHLRVTTIAPRRPKARHGRALITEATANCSSVDLSLRSDNRAEEPTALATNSRAGLLKLGDLIDATDGVSYACGDTGQEAVDDTDATMHPPKLPAKERIQALLQEGDTALKARDYVTAHARFTQAGGQFEIYTAELPRPGSLLGLAEIHYHAALATGGGRLGDPCPELGEAWRLSESARELARASRESNALAITEAFRGDVDKQVALYKCIGAGGSSVEQSLVGHYYLSGMREVGSELLLQSDGRFKWMLAYGSIDQGTSGTWQIVGTTLILTADHADTSAPLAVPGPFIAWNIDSENARRRHALDITVAAVAARCPFLATADSMTSTPRAYADDAEREAAKADAVKEITSATERERVSRGRLEDAVAAAMLGTADKSAKTAANTAVRSWQEADADLYNIYDRAGLQRPHRITPRLPASCTMPAFVEADSKATSDWISGLGVQVRFADENLYAAPINVTFHFQYSANDFTVESDRNGYAFLPAGARAWARVTLAIPTPKGTKTVALPVSPPQQAGIQTLLLNAKALATPPFETLRLTIIGNDLVPEGPLARGKYSRE